MTYTATYSPEDNKLRLRTNTNERLSSEEYEQVKAAGFKWAPVQGLFVAPAWTPSRNDLLITLCGSIDDEDTTLSDRAEERSERFEGYAESRGSEAISARNIAQNLAGNIPFGQPILVGHHSEKRARKVAEKIENGFRKAVDLWETSEYWTNRAQRAIKHVKYKERADVRSRRIKSLEAEQRKHEREINKSEGHLGKWSIPDLTAQQALLIANYDHISRAFSLEEYPRDLPASQYEGIMSFYSALKDGIITPKQAQDLAITTHQNWIARNQRWVSHLKNRLVYERAMLGEQGGIVADQYSIQAGGSVLVRGAWSKVVRVTKRSNKVTSVRTDARFGSLVNVEEIKGYTPPTEESAAAAAEKAKLPQLVNFPGDGFACLTSAEYKQRHSDLKRIRKVQGTDEQCAYRYREIWTPADNWKLQQVFLTDAKRVDIPSLQAAPVSQEAAPVSQEAAPVSQEAAPIEDGHCLGLSVPADLTERQAQGDMFQALKEQLRCGVKAVQVHQLFETSQDNAQKMVDIAEIKPGYNVLEPNGGKGAILKALRKSFGSQINCDAIEINRDMCEYLKISDPLTNALNADFLQIDPVEKYDAILMNPPFENGSDIHHIKHAMKFLKPGGVLVAICAAGPKQKREIEPIAEYWEPLAAGAFADQGTMVNTAMLLIRAS